MIITTKTIGTGKNRRSVYVICTTPQENGSSRPEEITRFDTMEAAALVLRYLTGAALDAEDAARVREILRTMDTKGAKQDRGTE